MSFADTYHHEVLQSRRDRSRRAFFWARIVGIALMITLAATLRADPQLRGLLMQAGIEGVMKVANLKAGAASGATPPGAAAAPPQSGTLPTARIKINRPGDTAGTAQQPDTAALAQDVARQLSARQP